MMVLPPRMASSNHMLHRTPAGACENSVGMRETMKDKYCDIAADIRKHRRNHPEAGDSEQMLHVVNG
jgi:hypothetical protein